MSLFAALTTAVGGLAAQSNAIGNVSDNLANTETTGFKSISTQFESMVTQSTASINDPGGVRATPHYNNDVQGSLVQSSSSTSLAISGQGFFPVRAGVVNADGSTSIGTTPYFTREGDFTLDKNGYLVNGSGYYLTGYDVDTSGNVDASHTGAIMLSALLDNPVATSGISYSANLPSSVPSTIISPFSSSPSTLEVYDSLGGTHSLSFTWRKATDDLQATVTVVNGITLTAKNSGTAGNNYEVTLTDVGATTTARIINTGSGATIATYAGLPDVTTQTAAPAYDLWAALRTVINADATAPISAALPAGTTGAADPAANLAIPLAGGLDINAHPNLWYLDIVVPNGGGVVGPAVQDYTATIPFTFNSTSSPGVQAGTVQTITASGGTGASGTYTVGLTGAAEVTLPLDFSGSGATGTQSVVVGFGNYNSSSNALTQFADANNAVSVSTFDQNGIPRGSFQNLSIDKNGFVSLNYDNGQTRIISQIPLAQFFAQDQLQRVTGGAYLQTLASGAARRSTPGTNGAGTIVGNSLESSNVDIADEFTKLIQAQRVYSANARTITTADNMLQEVISIIR
jgi:flagellar hook protein FlgE